MKYVFSAMEESYRRLRAQERTRGRPHPEDPNAQAHVIHHACPIDRRSLGRRAWYLRHEPWASCTLDSGLPLIQVAGSVNAFALAIAIASVRYGSAAWKATGYGCRLSFSGRSTAITVSAATFSGTSFSS